MPENLSIGIIGLGHVGQAFANYLSPHAEIVTYDCKLDGEYPADALAHCHFTMICVDTPTAADGSCDITNVRAAVTCTPSKHVLIKSTIPPGTVQALAEETGKEICFSPEYIAESAHTPTRWGADPAQVPFVIIGGQPSSRQYLLRYLAPIIGSHNTIFQCSAAEAEMIKYMENSYLAMKVAFVNEYYDLCAETGLDWHRVREGWLLDPRINRSHTVVHEEARGFGGKCLPKDLSAIISFARNHDVDFTLMEAIAASNRIRRRA